MTPLPSSHELLDRSIFNPAPGSFHFNDLVKQLKDGVYAKDRTSDYITGLFLFAKEAGKIPTWVGQLLQIPFVKGMKIRKSHPNFGYSFRDPDGKVMQLGGRVLRGSLPEGDFQISKLSVADVLAHGKYKEWHRLNYEGNGLVESYTRVSNRDSIIDCDEYINSVPYTPGPLSLSLDDYYKWEDATV